MSLVRMAGLIALPLLATTLQASMQSTPAAASDQPAPLPVRPPAPQAAQRSEKSQPILIIAPNTDVWHDHGSRLTLDGPGPAPICDLDGHVRPAAWQPEAAWAPVQDRGRPATQTMHPWLVGRYPNAPPA